MQPAPPTLEYLAAEERIANALVRSEHSEFAGRFTLVGTVAAPGLFDAFGQSAPGRRVPERFQRWFT